MDNKKKALVFFLASAIGAVVGYVLTNSLNFNLCSHDEYSCRDVFNQIGDPLMYGMGALTLVFLMLILVPRAWGAWKKFAVWFVPLAAILFFFYKDPGSGDLVSPYAEAVFQWVSAAYVVISAIIITLAAGKKA